MSHEILDTLRYSSFPAFQLFFIQRLTVENAIGMENNSNLIIVCTVQAVDKQI